MSHLGMITVVVDDYDVAIDYYTNALGFTLVEDTKMSEVKRWVVVAPDVNQGAALLLAKAASSEQSAAIGNQAVLERGLLPTLTKQAAPSTW